MAFNKFMHPKNPYRSRKPDFKDLALKYEEFRKYSTQDTGGKVHLDFKAPECLRALSWALLKNDFDIDVDMPLERLIPTIPLRLNYILWLKDIIGEKTDVHGIDIGCGASCVYPLLASKMYGWKMVTTEVDDLNLTYAKRNVEKNEMGESIRVVEVKEGSGLSNLLETENCNFDFCMCNPPFFESNIEAYGLTSSRKPDRAEPKSVSTASEHESIVEGGEVAYVQQMITDSLQLRNRIRVYTTMLGKKKSAGVLKNELQTKKIKNVASYTFCQGRTMRWGLAWSFDETVKFPSCPFSTQKKPRPQQPLVFTVKPSKIECTVDRIGQEVKKIIEDLKIEHTVVMSSSVVWSVSATARENTWSHSRRKRREEARRQSEGGKCAKLDSGESAHLVVDEGTSKSEGKSGTKIDSELGKCAEKMNSDSSNEEPSGVADNMDISEVDNEDSNEGEIDRDKKLSEQDSVGSGVSSEARTGSLVPMVDETEKTCPDEWIEEGNGADLENAATSAKCALGKKKESMPLFKCWVSVRKEKPGIILEMKWMRGTSKEALHQLFQYFKNHFR
ncbi:RNA N6-adenosine-methyltransferase mettl16-like isoform X2 [Lineus longissimus]